MTHATSKPAQREADYYHIARFGCVTVIVAMVRAILRAQDGD
jgi:hypothetical protein